MSDTGEPLDDDHARAMEEARTLLSAGLVSELITNIDRMARAVSTFAEELREDRVTRAEELRSLRRRNGVQAVGLVLSIILLALVVVIGGARLTHIAEENRDNLSRQTADFLDAAFCVAEHGFDHEADVHTCYRQRIDARARLLDTEGTP